MPDSNRHLNPPRVDIDLSWMVGCVIAEVAFLEPETWRFLIGTNVWIAAECPWRIVRDGRIALSSVDHGQIFGLPAPIDAAAAATSLFASGSISAAHLREGTADLLIDFEGNLRLEIIPLSSGYESFEWADPSGDCFFVQGGGNIVRFPKP